MEEQLRIFDQNKHPIGVASRRDVHHYGYWHEVFHCWMITLIEGEYYVYLQLRSPFKKDYPGLYDITAAGHLLADESVEDGIREVEEELGISVQYEDLTSLDILSYQVENDTIIDKEFANVFLLNSRLQFDDFKLQVEEVTGMIRVKLNDFEQLWSHQADQVKACGFKIGVDGQSQSFEERIGREDFVAHDGSFYREVVRRIKGSL